jgi:hypothetical protein
MEFGSALGELGYVGSLVGCFLVSCFGTWHILVHMFSHLEVGLATKSLFQLQVLFAMYWGVLLWLSRETRISPLI